MDMCSGSWMGRASLWLMYSGILLSLLLVVVIVVNFPPSECAIVFVRTLGVSQPRFVSLSRLLCYGRSASKNMSMLSRLFLPFLLRAHANKGKTNSHCSYPSGI